MNWIQKPLGVGAVLDRSFQLYRKNFARLFLLSLIFLGPLYLVLSFLLYGATKSIGGKALSSNSIEDYTYGGVFDPLFQGSGEYEWVPILLVVLVYLIMPVYALLLAPPAIASNLNVVRDAYEQKRSSLGELLKRSFNNYWPSVGNTFLFGLILTGVYIALSIVTAIIAVVFFAVVSGTMGGLFNLDGGSVGSGIVAIMTMLLLYFVAIFVLSVIIYYFIIRFGFYLPIVALEKEFSPIKKSWRLTKGSFWRIFWIFFVISLVSSVFVFGGTAAAYGLMFAELQALGSALFGLISLLTVPLTIVTYAVVYFDLKVRTEGSDLDQLLSKDAPYPYQPPTDPYGNHTTNV